MSNPDLSRLNILVVDDNDYMLRILKTIFVAMEISNVRYVRSVKEALQSLKHDVPDIVITDWEMKPVDGIEFTSFVRGQNDERFNSIPIILLTGHTEYERVVTAIKAGVSDVLAKPVSIETLYRRLCRLIDISSLPAEHSSRKGSVTKPEKEVTLPEDSEDDDVEYFDIG
ncbi:response regulator [Kiloniella sp. b19]|uniref:response regulator n=1 Tax=Kiloniella sp. GXU_MW_B19 TaxID=3141326 RepID=UPI0031E3346F